MSDTFDSVDEATPTKKKKREMLEHTPEPIPEPVVAPSIPTISPSTKPVKYLKVSPLPENVPSPRSAHLYGVAPGLYYGTDDNMYLVSDDNTSVMYIYASGAKVILSATVDMDALTEKAFLQGQFTGYKEAIAAPVANEPASTQVFTMQDMLKVIATVSSPQPLASAVADNERQSNGN